MEWSIITVTLGTCVSCFLCIYYCLFADLVYKKLFAKKTAIYKINLQRKEKQLRTFSHLNQHKPQNLENNGTVSIFLNEETTPKLKTTKEPCFHHHQLHQTTNTTPLTTKDNSWPQKTVCAPAQLARLHACSFGHILKCQLVCL